MLNPRPNALSTHVHTPRKFGQSMLIQPSKGLDPGCQTDRCSAPGDQVPTRLLEFHCGFEWANVNGLVPFPGNTCFGECSAFDICLTCFDDFLVPLNYFCLC